MVSGWIITLGLVWAYVILLFWLLRSGKMEKWNLSLFLGFILMVRTQHGRATLDTIARPRRFWNLFGDFGIFLTLGGMALMTFFLVLTVRIVLDPAYGVEPLAASEILVIPGINPFVPLWYGIIALIVTLVVHEGGHGVLARANDLKVKSLGLLYLIVPIGAFVEPDEEELGRTSRRKRMRVFGAGATVNIVLAVLVLAAVGAMAAGATAHPGVPVQSVTEGGGAAAVDIQTTDVITGFDGEAVTTFDDLNTRIDAHEPGDTVDVTLRDGRELTVTLTSRWDVLPETDADGLDRQDILAYGDDARETCEELYGERSTDGGACAEQMAEDPLLGFAPYPVHAIQDVFTDPFGNGGRNVAFLIQMPIQEIRGQPHMGVFMPAFFETPFSPAVFWPLFNALFWIFWINLLVGLTNILPMLPLDGGHMFRDAVAALVEKTRPGIEQARRDRIVSRSATTVSLLIFASIILQIVGPRLVG